MVTLAKSNPYLATADQRKRAVRVTIATSSAIEGIHAPFREKEARARAPGKKGARRGNAGEVG
jgi:hypothetical protein